MFYVLNAFMKLMTTLVVQRNGVIFVSGDVHFGEITRFDCGAQYPLYDVTSSGLTQSVEDSVPAIFRPLMRFLALVTPTTMRVLSPNCQYKSCSYGMALSAV
jgi:alkaline phosphatase D